MRRHPALHPLSRDHHDVLLHARRLRDDDARVDAATAATRFARYLAVLRLHFAEEDAVLAPRIADPALRRRLLDEHAALLRLAEAGDPALLGARLRDHVRFEEDVLFPHLEASLPEAAWADIKAAGLAFRRRQRPASLTGDEVCFL